MGMGLMSLGILFLLFASLSTWNALYYGMPTYTRYVWEGSAAGGMGGYVLVTYEYSPWDFVAAFTLYGLMLATGIVLLSWSLRHIGYAHRRMENCGKGADSEFLNI